MKSKNRILAATVLVASSLSLTACEWANRNAYTGNLQLSNSSKGVAVGAVGGAAGAAALGAKEAVAGGVAAAGGVGGGIIGYDMDKQNAALRARLRNVGVKVIENVDDGGNDVTLILPSDIYFGTGSTALSHRFHQILDAVAIEMNEFKYSVAEIPGNIDAAEASRHQQRLAMQRAEAVADYLAARGIERERLVPKDKGEADPAASNHTPTGRAMNRRVYIILHQPPIV